MQRMESVLHVAGENAEPACIGIVIHGNDSRGGVEGRALIARQGILANTVT
jgi:hypothetical protein